MDENRNGHNNNGNGGAMYGTSNGLFGETDRDSGEYRFRSGMTQQVYTNASYMPENEAADPPRYYRPSGTERPGTKNSTEKKKKKKKGAGVAFILILCFICALLGGIAASIFTAQYMTGDGLAVLRSRASSAESAVLSEETSGEVAAEAKSEPGTLFPFFKPNAITIAASEPTPQPDLPASEVYDIACSQVVSIATDIVNVDRYGNRTPSAISGSGFIISSDGYILTNYHVVEYAVSAGINVTVTLYDGSIYVGSVFGTAREKDLAIIKIDKDDLKPASLGNSDTVSVGDTVYAVGNPYGVLEFTMSVGHISALDRLIATEESDENACSMFQIDAAVYSGNSGGPAYNSHGEVIGIVSAKYSTDGMEGIGFAIPVNDALPVVAELLDKGYIGGRAALNASFDERYNLVYSRYYGLPEGAYVYSVEPGGCADKAGIRSGDIIMRFGDYIISSYSDIARAIKNCKAGETVEIIAFRASDSTLVSADVTLDESAPDTSGDSISAYMARNQ